MKTRMITKVGGVAMYLAIAACVLLWAFNDPIHNPQVNWFACVACAAALMMSVEKILHYWKL